MDLDEFVYREKRLLVAWRPNTPYFIKYGHCVPMAHAHVGLYCVTKQMANQISLSGSVRGWKPIHYSIELVVDCDTLASSVDVETVLRFKSLSYKKYASGNKGFHFHIPRKAEPSETLCLRDKVLVEILFPGVEIDTGIYRPLHLIRGIDCRHEVTHRRKTLVEEFVGTSLLDATQIQLTDAQIEWFRHQETSDDRTEWTRFQDRVLLHYPAASGQSRNTKLFCLAKDVFRSGFSFDSTLEICSKFNASFQQPHTDEEVERAVRSAVAQVG